MIYTSIPYDCIKSTSFFFTFGMEEAQPPLEIFAYLVNTLLSDHA